MFVQLVTVHVWAGEWDEYEKVLQRWLLSTRPVAEGRRETWLIRSTSDENEGIVLTRWDDAASLAAFERTPAFLEGMLPALERLLAGEFPVAKGNVRFIRDESAGWRYRRSRFDHAAKE